MKQKIPAMLFETVRQKFPALILEILCIIIAVTLSFMLDEWRESQHEKEDLKEIVESLITDIELITDDYKNASTLYAQNGIDTIDLCLKMGAKGDIVNGALLENLVYYINDDHSFGAASSSAYVGLLSSNIWQQLPDSLRREVFDLYETDYKYLEITIGQFGVNNAYFKQHYFSELGFTFYNPEKGNTHTFDVMDSTSALVVQNALRNTEYRAALIVTRNQLNKIVRYQRSAVNHGESVLKMLNAYLNAV